MRLAGDEERGAGDRAAISRDVRSSERHENGGRITITAPSIPETEAGREVSSRAAAASLHKRTANARAFGLYRAAGVLPPSPSLSLPPSLPSSRPHSLARSLFSFYPSPSDLHLALLSPPRVASSPLVDVR